MYLDQEAELGSELLDTYEACEANIREFPESGHEVGMGIHKGLLQLFKYLIGYEIKGTGRAKRIRILCIHHYSQSRKDWGSRK